eukprot:153066-Prorocentrum_minimum.AAC.3
MPMQALERHVVRGEILFASECRVRQAGLDPAGPTGVRHLFRHASGVLSSGGPNTSAHFWVLCEFSSTSLGRTTALRGVVSSYQRADSAIRRG